MAIDGFDWDVPDTHGNAAEFGYAGAGQHRRRSRRRGWSPSASAGPTPRRCAAAAGGGEGTGEQNLARPSTRAWNRLAADGRPQLLWLHRLERRRAPAARSCCGGSRARCRCRCSRPPGRLLRLGGVRRDDPRAAPERLTRRPPARGGPSIPPGRRIVRVIEYTVPDRDGDGDRGADRPAHHDHRPARRPRRAARAGLPSAVGTRDRQQAAQDPPARAGQDPAVEEAGHGPPGDLRLPADPLRDQRADLPGRDRGRHRPRPGQVPAHRSHRPPPGRRPAAFSPDACLS